MYMYIYIYTPRGRSPRSETNVVFQLERYCRFSFMFLRFARNVYWGVNKRSGTESRMCVGQRFYHQMTNQRSVL